ncbi:unnamed protein product [Bursaphelenchus xylophilus]|uniref:(pine wood nematode) hypothetical protein n=1 Tax=Bursaphelenchus xylophilus TaxID=6326 RepID=A0A1I7S1Z3_BURXY|nr:unnamed protein product [Bursaphelenchus xylophilus]CAG9090147.1 unnamed protein product [Bursaphelenchus xylophilus]
MSTVRSDDIPTLDYLGVIKVFTQTAEPSTGGPSTSSSQNDWTRSLEEQIIDQIDCAQITGELPRTANKKTVPLKIHVSTLGVKFVNPKSNHCTQRLAMHKLIQCICFDADHDGLINLVILEQLNGSDHGLAHLFQTGDERIADQLCRQVGEAFYQLEEEARERAQAEQQRREAAKKERERLKRQKSTESSRKVT